MRGVTNYDAELLFKQATHLTKSVEVICSKFATSSAVVAGDGPSDSRAFSKFSAGYSAPTNYVSTSGTPATQQGNPVHN